MHRRRFPYPLSFRLPSTSVLRNSPPRCQPDSGPVRMMQTWPQVQTCQENRFTKTIHSSYSPWRSRLDSLAVVIGWELRSSLWSPSLPFWYSNARRHARGEVVLLECPSSSIYRLGAGVPRKVFGQENRSHAPINRRVIHGKVHVFGFVSAHVEEPVSAGFSASCRNGDICSSVDTLHFTDLAPFIVVIILHNTQGVNPDVG